MDTDAEKLGMFGPGNLCFICVNLWLNKKQAARSPGKLRRCGRRWRES
jgi:hypothetical protein